MLYYGVSLHPRRFVCQYLIGGSQGVTTTRGQHLIGKEVGGCLLEKLIGYGGSSAVFLAQPRTSDAKVAVKVFLPRTTMNAQMQKNFYRRFLREAQAASELEHPNILSIYSYGEHQGYPYIVMPYMPGGTLSEYVKEYGPLSLRDAQSYLQQIAAALDYAHQHGCVHCDVKPANILMGQDGQVVLTDFGIVRMMQEGALVAQQSTKSPEALMGTPDYISPEQALGEPLDGRSDIYSLAVTLYFLLTGSPPFKADSSIAMALMHVHETPAPLGATRADATPTMESALNKALAKWPQDRYQSAGAFSKAFAEALASVPNIDRVALAKHREKLLLWNGNGHDDKLKPSIQVKPLGKKNVITLPVPRMALLLGVLGLVLLLSISTAIILQVSAAHTQSLSPTATPSDYLGGDQDAWPSGPSGGSFFFAKDGYHIKNMSRQALAVALYGEYTFSNIRLTVSASELVGTRNGADYFGVVLRAAQDQSHFYIFDITAYNGGQFEFLRYDGQWHTIMNGTLPLLHTAPRQINTITIEAKGNSYTILINNVSLGPPIVDRNAHPFTSGEIGLIVEEQGTEVVFSALSITKLP